MNRLVLVAFFCALLAFAQAQDAADEAVSQLVGRLPRPEQFNPLQEELDKRSPNAKWMRFGKRSPNAKWMR